MKGYLKCGEAVFQLAPKVTTVGREGCDLVIQSPGIDLQHALIEYSDDDQTFVLQDLNSAHGTFVNDCRVQNVAVRLTPNDIIRFGCTSNNYVFDTDAVSQLTYPPVHQRVAWTQPITIISEPRTMVMPQAPHGLPQLSSVVATTQTTWTNSSGQPMPRPPPATVLRSRPLSAGSAAVGSRRMVPDDRFTDQPRIMTGMNRSPALTTNTLQTTGMMDLTAFQEKEQEIQHLTNEVHQLKANMDNAHVQGAEKEMLIQRLRKEIQDLQVRMRQYQTSQVPAVTQPSNQAAAAAVEVKNLEIQSLRQQIDSMKSELETRSSAVPRQDLNDRIQEVNSLRAELERVRKDKNITSGLVTRMQQDMSNKDTTISRLTRDVENMKKEIEAKDVQLTSMQSKFKRIQDNRKTEEEFQVKEQELAQLKQNLKSTENKIQDQDELVKALREELEKTQKGAMEEKEVQRKLKSDLDQIQTQQEDIQRAERQVRIDLEQMSKRLERFRSRVIQVTFSTPGIKAPSGEIQDDELMDTLKKIIDERTEMNQLLIDAKENLNTANAARKEISESGKKLKQQISESLNRLKDGGQLAGRIKQEVELLSAVCVDESICWVKETVLEMLQTQQEWETAIEAALEECGVNVKLSQDAPGTHILALKSKWETGNTEKEALVEKMNALKEQHGLDLQQALDNLKQELADKATADMEKTRLDSDEKMNKAIDEIRALEEEKRENMLQAEKVKVAELEAAVEQLKASIINKESEEQENKDTTRDALEQLEKMKALEVELREQISSIEKQKQEQIEKLQMQIIEKQQKEETEVTSYKEQIKQHSVTICAMEERLNKLLKKNKEYQAEINTLKGTITELNNRPKPAAPPKPKVIIQKPAQDIMAMEQLITQLRQENADYQQQVHDLQDIVTGLRKDLAGASARLSDMKGELSEGQKEELEKNRQCLLEQEAELLELRQQMVKLSQIVDKQAAEVKDVNADLNKQKNALNKYKSLASERDSRVKDLEVQLRSEQEEAKKHYDLMQEEGRITSELTSLGAHCRGERHEQIIARQREALAELRGRIRTLEQSHPPLPSQDSALQQVILLKKELAEMRANQALSDNKAISNSILEQQVNKARGIEPQSRAEADIERSAHRETMESLELSENSFLMLLRAMSSTLEMDDVGGLRSIAHIPKDERARLYSEREQACELLASRIKVLRERIARKDELLQGYERDLAKLRQAEQLADHKQSQVECLSTEIRNKTEEAEYLRESLNRTRERLDHEKRTAAAIKLRKVVQADSGDKGGWRKHNCLTDEPVGKGIKKKERNEVMKRKNYEIRTLKTELTNREKQLDATHKKLENLQTSFGLHEEIQLA